MSAGNEHFSIRTYGRRKGHALSPRRTRLLEELLPRLKLDLSEVPPAPLTSLFAPGLSAPGVSQVWLEIGFGAGEHLAWQAQTHPDAGIIGCEPFINGVAALLGEIDERNIGNIRIWDDDARDVLDWLEDASIDRVFVLYPDPWPKARHHKRRLISPRTLKILARVMKRGAELRIGSDITDYVRATLEAVFATPDFEWLAERAEDWRTRPPDWPQTRYEKKAIQEGRKGHCLIFRRI